MHLLNNAGHAIRNEGQPPPFFVRNQRRHSRLKWTVAGDPSVWPLASASQRGLLLMVSLGP
jgi:hypothetical protein